MSSHDGAGRSSAWDYRDAMFFEWPPRESPADPRPVPRSTDDTDEPVIIGGVVPVEVLIARSDTGALAIRGLVAYPTGFEFTIVAHTRRDDTTSGHRSREFRPIVLLLDELDDDDVLPRRFLRVGIQFPDGTRVTNLRPSRWRAGPNRPSHGIDFREGGGSDVSFASKYWAWPIPEAGVLTVVCEWPSQSISESRIDIDASLIADAAARSHPVWDS